MMTANQYGNSGAYFNDSPNTRTRAMLGLGGSTKSNVSSYSVIWQGGVPISSQARMAAGGIAIIGWVGHRPVAFPLVAGWNFDADPT